MFVVMMPYSPTSSRTGLGAEISKHRTAKAAFDAIKKEVKKARQRFGDDVYLDRYVWDSVENRQVTPVELDSDDE